MKVEFSTEAVETLWNGGKVPIRALLGSIGGTYVGAIGMVVSASVAASKTSLPGTVFVLIWSMVLTIAVCVALGLFMLNESSRTKYSLGMTVMFCVLVGQINMLDAFNYASSKTPPFISTTVFTAFLCATLTSCGALLWITKADLVPKEYHLDQSPPGQQAELVPPQVPSKLKDVVLEVSSPVEQA